MGDTRRFWLFADMIARNVPAAAPVADVAGGKGYLQAALRQRGFGDVTSWDRRPRNAKNRRGYRYGHFDYRSAPREYGAVVGMHPDGGTDQIIAYARKHRVPFLVCPCCVIPTATKYEGYRYEHWIEHLIRFAEAGRFDVNVTNLPMKGRNIVLIGRPV